MMPNVTTPKLFLLITVFIGLIFLSSCSTYEPFVPPADFDESTYINPEDYGVSLAFPYQDDLQKMLANENEFIPVRINGGIDNAIQDHVHTRSGGRAVIELYVDTTGTLTQIKRIESTNRAVARSLEKLAQKVDFKAALLRGNAVNSYRQIQVYFQIRVTTTSTEPAY